MRFHGESNRSVTGLLILVLFYLFLIALILFFSQYIISNISSTSPLANTLAIFVILVLPLLLLGAIVYNIVKLIKERTKKKAGAKLKTRLFIFFTFIALISLVPQALFSISFINSAIDFWFSSRIGEAMEGGFNIAFKYYISKVDNLKRFSNGSVFPILLYDLDGVPEKTWQNIKDANPEINLIQIFNSNGEDVFFHGDENARITDFESLERLINRPPTKEVRGSLSILRVLKKYNSGKNSYSIILGIVFPKKFEEHAGVITESRSTFKQLYQYKDLFRIVLVLFYFLFSFPILLLSILVSFLLAEEIIRPIVNLEQATRRISEGDFSFRILTRTHDELSVLVGSFNRMVSELEYSRKKLIQAERISAWKDIAQRLAHEIKNPLTPIKLSAQRIIKKAGEKPEILKDVINKAVPAIINEVDNLNKLLIEFREFTRLEPSFYSVNIKSLIEEVLSVYENLSSKIQFETRFHADNIIMMIDKNQIKQVFANLLSNSIQAIEDEGNITITTALIKKEDNNYLRIQIHDTGKGMNDEAKEKLFEPYYTTKKDGSGLGLAIVEKIIFDHNGSIWFETKKDSGTTFYIDLPEKV